MQAGNAFIGRTAHRITSAIKRAPVGIAPTFHDIIGYANCTGLGSRCDEGTAGLRTESPRFAGQSGIRVDPTRKALSNRHAKGKRRLSFRCTRPLSKDYNPAGASIFIRGMRLRVLWELTRLWIPVRFLFHVK
jgi:hypothetical protein